ncbi:hypothetical protein UFOVP715_47 [uncultured Caudovirales phage]|uniref:Uncharacterized protein n=1 Tax=uncultured Caudovirales phage TaxID=2100421 RepID=A0A6J5NR76_9CAUD|nr:hypothetical protein UFOVP715_47 [uncultured Caudovirales phage]
MFKERMTRAQESKDLGEVPSNEIGDVDLVRAMGMAGASNPLGTEVWRWLYNRDKQSMMRVAEALVGQGYAVVVVHRVLVHMDSDVCPACFGRGYKVVPNTPMLSDELCVDCKGVGRKDIQGEAEQALVDVIKRLEREIGTALMQKLRNE